MIPADTHVHTQWSWDAVRGSMAQSCVRALEFGLPAVAFTDHADYSTFVVGDDLYDQEAVARLGVRDGLATPPRFDLDGYLDCLHRCRDQFPGLRILSGVELGEPHWHQEAAGALLQAGQFDRVLGSLHCLRVGDLATEPPDLFRQRPADQVVRDYLAEVIVMIETSGSFSVLAHLDYPLRYWPSSAGPVNVTAFESEFRAALRALARSERAMEINTSQTVHGELISWWHDAGGNAISFGSDAHSPAGLAKDFSHAAELAEGCGFRPNLSPYELWSRA